MEEEWSVAGERGTQVDSDSAEASDRDEAGEGGIKVQIGVRRNRPVMQPLRIREADIVLRTALIPM